MKVPTQDWNNLFLNDISLLTEIFLDDVINGLSQPNKTLPSKYLYDQQGAYYFDRICETPEYYLTRTELSIMEHHLSDMVKDIGEQCLVIEYGSGLTRKTDLLLSHLSHPTAYIPIDIFSGYLQEAQARFNDKFPNVEVLPLCCDFTNIMDIPKPQNGYKRRLIYVPGSTLSNFSPSETYHILRHMHAYCREGDLCLLGLDLKKNKDVLCAAYNDQQGWTAAFNLNLLTRINRELGADFQKDFFRHRIFYNAFYNRIEMHLTSIHRQTIRIGDLHFPLLQDESIHTESSYKYDIHSFTQLARTAGLELKNVWTDKQHFFGILMFEMK
jgi:dimethylhistidine N-methyltransferase